MEFLGWKKNKIEAVLNALVATEGLLSDRGFEPQVPKKPGMGEQGMPGPQAPQGARGESGPPGPQGSKGERGAAGPQGAKGRTRPSGTAGATGCRRARDSGSAGAARCQVPRRESQAPDQQKWHGPGSFECDAKHSFSPGSSLLYGRPGLFGTNNRQRASRG
jgi:hypothetical protein